MPRAKDIFSLVGTVVAGKYRFDEVVDRGGFSVVYRAYHLVLRQPVAVKCFVSLATDDDGRAEHLDRFAREGALLTALSSRSVSIVQARDMGVLSTETHASVPYLVLEWLEGRSLEAVLHKSGGSAPRLGLAELFRLFDGVCRALALAHSVGVAHRDIKPANIYVLGGELTPHATLKLLDFGIAKVMDMAAPELTATSGSVFSPQYAAPEQYNRGLGATGPWTDVHAICLVLLELMRGGQRVYPQREIQVIAVACLDPKVRPTPRALGLEVSDAVEAVFARATAIAVADRYPDIGSFWAELAAALELPSFAPIQVLSQAELSLPGPSERPGSSLVAASTTGASIEQAEGTTGVDVTVSRPPAAQPSRARPIMFGGGALVVAALGAGTWVMTRPDARVEPAQAVAQAPVATPTEPAAAPPAAAAAPASPCPQDMAFIQGGRFFRGSDDVDNKALTSARPAHQVEVADFCLGLNEVTVAEYRECSERGECKRAFRDSFWPKGQTDKKSWEQARAAWSPLCNEGVDGRERHPVNCVTWEQADQYCRRGGGRLPTEAEWEFAARGSDGRVYPWGDAKPGPTLLNGCGVECRAFQAERGLGEVPALYAEDDGFPGTAPVGSFPGGRAQAGLYDMVGNVWEWTADAYAVYPGGEAKLPDGLRVIRGGGFNSSYPAHAEPALRYGQDPTAHVHAIGFRCARTPGG